MHNFEIKILVKMTVLSYFVKIPLTLLTFQCILNVSPYIYMQAAFYQPAARKNFHSGIFAPGQTTGLYNLRELKQNETMKNW